MTVPSKTTRSDAWGENLPEETRWAIYRWSKTPIEEDGQEPRLPRYPEDVESHLSQLSHASLPSRAGWYRFLARMRKEEMLRRVYAVQASGEVATDMAKVTIDDASAAEALKGLAIDAAMSGDDKSAAIYATAATAFRDRAQKASELELKERAQATKDEQLRLAREKFEAAERRIAAVQDAVTSARDKGGLTEETLKKIEEAAGLL